MNIHKMDEMELTDTQRALVLGLAGTRRKIQQLMASSATGVTVDAQNASMHGKLEILKCEAEDLEQCLLASLGSDTSETARRKREKLADAFDRQDEEDVWDEYSELCKKQKFSEYPDIPTIDASENLESVRAKLVSLRDLHSKTLLQLSGHESDKKLSETANEDEEEIDPLEAFMAETTAEIASQQISKTSDKLAEIERIIAQFERLETLLSQNQFSDHRLADALQQKEKLLRKQREAEKLKSKPSSEQSARGQGTVWEEEFRKDDSVPIRLEPRTEKPSISVMPQVRLNASKGGLFVPGQSDQPPGQTVSAQRPQSSPESSEKRQEELRKKLGY